jgi:hypothetical protein
MKWFWVRVMLVLINNGWIDFVEAMLCYCTSWVRV